MKKLPYLCLVGLLLAAFAAETRAQSNTLVRFRISYGTRVLGTLDLELFDQDKPLTVSNFLAYVDSGQYKRTLLHRLIPGFVLQGGAGEIVNPYSLAFFQIVNRTQMGPPITNEFSTGTIHSNLFGTIAMAKRENEPHSATSSWFINLADNSANRTNALENLDQQNGGFTVFGRVVAGTNLLHTFNRYSSGNGIMNVADLFYAFACGSFTYVNDDGEYSFFAEGTDVPVSFAGLYCVRYADLLVVDIFRLNGVTADTTSPTVALAAPLVNTTITSDSLTVSGTASDNVGVTSVDVILNHEALFTFPGSANWSGTVTNIQPGTNTLTVLSLDANANESKPVFRNFFYKVERQLPLEKVGEGTVIGLTNGQTIVLGRNYKLVAKAAPGYLFNGWEGTFLITSPSGDPSEPTLMFYARTNTSIKAVFIRNPFIPTKGTYNGLFSEAGTVHSDRAGYFTLTLTDRGTYSGKITLDGRPLPFKGLFQTDGSSSLQLVRRGSNDVFLRLNLDLTNGTCQVTGAVSALSGTWSVPIIADCATYNIRTNPAPRAGLYNMIIPGTAGSSTQPQGDSYATIKIDGNGRVTVIGSMADGSKLVHKTTISKNGTIPLYGNLYAGKGMVIGWLDIVTGNPSTDVVGDVGWLKPPVTVGAYYPGGFLVMADAFGSTFVKPATPTNRVVNLPTGTVSFTGGNLLSSFTNAITIAPNSLVTTTSPNKLALALNKATGLMAGVAFHPNGTPIVKFRGVVLQKQESAAGYFLGTNASGRVLVGP